jgi:hypothetical protein
MKKILSLTLVLVLVLSSFSMAFADNHASTKFDDVEDEDIAIAVDRLSAFGIVDGYEDGSYKPEGMVTRAEFSKLLVTALGLENAAGAAGSSSQFADVMGTEWYAGFVNVAAGQGIVGGYPDGTFKPNAQVSYGEAVTMLVRALGYQDEFLPGQWPSNYISKAASLDITDDVNFFATGYADRGSVAILLNNTLDADIVEAEDLSIDGSNSTWKEQEGKTLLTENLGFDKYEALTLTDVPKVSSSVDSDQVRFDTTDDSKLNGDDDNLSSSYEFDTDMIDAISNRLGESLDVYVDDDEIVFYQTAESKFTVKWATIASDGDISDDELTLTFVDGSDSDYDFDEDEISVYVDNEDKDIDSNTSGEHADDVFSAGQFGKFVIGDNGDIILADLHEWDQNALIVTSADDEKIEFIEGEGSDDEIEADDFDRVVVMDTEGNVMDMEDVQEDSVIYINDDAEEAESGDEVAYIVVVLNDIAYEVADSYDTDGFEFDTEDNEYDVNETTGTVSVDEDDEFVYFTDAADELETMTDESSNVELLFDIVKDVRHIRTDADVSSKDEYGIVLGTNVDDFDNDEIEIKLLNAAGDKEVYEVDYDEDEFLGFDSSVDTEAELAEDPADNEYGLVDGDIVKYTLNGDGEIDSLIVINDRGDNKSENGITITEEDFNIDFGTLSDDLDEDSIELGSDNFTVDSNILVFDYSESDPADVETVTYSSIVDAGDGDDVLVVSDDNGEAEFLVYYNASLGSDDEFTGYVLETMKKGEDDYVELVMQDGTTEEYEVDDVQGGYSNLNEETIVVYEMNADGTIDIIGSLEEPGQSEDFDFVVGQVIDVDGSYLKIRTTSTTATTIDVTVKVDSDTVVYQEDDEKDDNDIDEFDVISLTKDGSHAKVVKIYDIDTTDFTAANSTDAEVELFEADFERINSATLKTLEFDVNGYMQLNQ